MLPKNLIRFLLYVWNSESTGDLKYFVNGLKYFADILIKDGDDAIKITQENQPLRTVPGLMNFVASAEDLFDSNDLTRQEHATLVIAIFAGHTVIEALQHLFQNRRFHFECTPDEFHAENSFHLRDLVRIAKKLGLRMPQDSSMLKKPVISPMAKGVKQTRHGPEHLPQDSSKKTASTDAIISMTTDIEEAQHGYKVLDIKITGSDKTNLFVQVYRDDEVIDFLGGKHLQSLSHPKPCGERGGEMKAGWGADELGGAGDEVHRGYDLEDRKIAEVSLLTILFLLSLSCVWLHTFSFDFAILCSFSLFSSMNIFIIRRRATLPVRRRARLRIRLATA